MVNGNVINNNENNNNNTINTHDYGNDDNNSNNQDHPRPNGLLYTHTHIGAAPAGGGRRLGRGLL